MARSAKTTLRLNLKSELTLTLNDATLSEHTVGGDIASITMLNGGEANQANRAWRRQSWTISSGATEDLDVYDLAAQDIGGGLGRDALGQLWICEEVVFLYVKQTAGPGRLEINATSPANKIPWVPTLSVANGGALRSGGLMLLHNPDASAFDITQASEDTVRFGANGGDVTIDVMIVGRSDDEVSSSSTSSSTSSSSTSSESSSVSTSSSSSSSSLSSSSSSSLSSSSLSSSTTSSISSSSTSSLSSSSTSTLSSSST